MSTSRESGDGHFTPGGWICPGGKLVERAVLPSQRHPMARKLTLGLAAIGVALVLALWLERRHAGKAVTLVVAVQEVASPLTAGSSPPTSAVEISARSERVEVPDPLDPVVEFLRAVNPRVYRSLTATQARALTDVDVVTADISTADVQKLLTLPSLRVVKIDAGRLVPVDDHAQLKASLARSGVQVIGYFRSSR
jgi:hypothetical protein